MLVVNVSAREKAFIFNKNKECLSRKELEAIQLEHLKQTLKRVYENVPFYTHAFDKAGVTADISSLSELVNFPFTKKTHLRENYPFGLFAVPTQEVRRIHASSGTKSKPTVVGYTDRDLENWKEVCARSLAAGGARPGDIIHNAYGYGLFTGGLGVHYGAENLKATVVPASGGRTQQQILLLQDFGARVLCSTPSYALNIAQLMADLEISRHSIKLEIGIFGAEPWTEELRKEIESALEIQALDIYGLSEVMGPGVSMECMEGRRGLHIWEDHFLAEIVSPETGERLDFGEEGELVFTSLTKEAIPVIRYRTGDISRLYPEPCVCGRTMMRMERVRARLDDMLIVRGVNLFPSEVETVLLNIDELSPHYQIVLGKKRALDTIEIHVEVKEELVDRLGSFDENRSWLTLLNGKVCDALKDLLGLTADVRLMKPRTVPRSEGKAVRVVDNRAAESKE